MIIQHIGLELYSVRKDLSENFDKTLEDVRNIGYREVEFAGDFVHDADKVANSLRASGLICCGWHTPWDYVQPANIERTIEYFRKIQNPFVIIPGLPHDLVQNKEGWLRVADQFNALSVRLAKENMRIGYHNHHREFIPYEDGTLPYYTFFDRTCDAVVVQLDNGNACKGGADLHAVIERYPNRLTSIHIKPYSKKDGFDTMIGDDDIDLEAFVRACDEIGGTERYIVEYESEKNYTPLKGVKLCFDRLVQLGLVKP